MQKAPKLLLCSLQFPQVITVIKKHTDLLLVAPQAWKQRKDLGFMKSVKGENIALVLTAAYWN